MTIKDIKHLQWIYERMVFKYKELEDFDYMIKFKEIIGKLKTSDDYIRDAEENQNLDILIKWMNEQNENKRIKIIEFHRTAEIDETSVHCPSLKISRMGEFIYVKLYQFY